MAGHRPFKELTKGFSEARQARVVGRASELETEIDPTELRQAPEPTRAGWSNQQEETNDTPDE